MYEDQFKRIILLYMRYTYNDLCYFETELG